VTVVKAVVQAVDAGDNAGDRVFFIIKRLKFSKKHQPLEGAA